jgi:multidrug resistance efflux pump
VTAQQSDAQAAYSAAEDILHKSNITSPFDGVVYVLPSSRAYVQAGDLLLQVADLSKVWCALMSTSPISAALFPDRRPK